jgi:hypothetical protein
LSEGFTRPASSIVTIVAMIASFALLSMSMRTLPLGTAIHGVDRHWRGRSVRARHPRSW